MTRARLVPALILLAVSLASVWPIMSTGDWYVAHQAHRYPYLLELFKASFLAGHAYPRWLPELLGRYGYPTFLYYPPGFWFFALPFALILPNVVHASYAALIALFDGPRIVVEDVEANAFQYMTGGVALVLGPAGFNLGSGMTGGVVYLLDADTAMLNTQYVAASPLDEADLTVVRALLQEHLTETKSPAAERLLADLDPARFARVATRLAPERLE